MSVYRRFTRAKKGIGTIFGGLFFIILILMGFNLMLWNFIQLDAYNTVINSVNQKNQEAVGENLVPNQPGATEFDTLSSSFNITVNNLGVDSFIARIYITNISPTGSSQCTSSPCIVNPAPASPSFSGGNIPAGTINHRIKVTGLLINDGSGYKVVLATTRGRLFSFFYPWPQAAPTSGSGGTFVTNVGPLQFSFASNSFNYTMGFQTQSSPAWVVRDGVKLIFWLKVTNTATSDVTIQRQSGLLLMPYEGALGATFDIYGVSFFIVNPSSVCPETGGSCQSPLPYTTPQVLPAGGPGGPGPATIVKFSAKTEGGSVAQLLEPGNVSYIIFIVFFYTWEGRFQGQTIPFVATRACNTAPTIC